MLKDKPIVRDAVYEAFRGQCFYTGRPIEKKDMVIDHVIALAQGGKDCIENYVLTFADFNQGKGSKYDPQLLKALLSVDMVYAHRVRLLIRKAESKKRLAKRRAKREKEASKAHKRGKQKTNKRSKASQKSISLEPQAFTWQERKPKGLRFVSNKDLVLDDDNGIQVYTRSTLVTKENFSKFISQIEGWADVVNERDLNFYEVWMSKREIKVFTYIWFKARDQYFPLIHVIEAYDPELPRGYFRVYLSDEFLQLQEWRELEYDNHAQRMLEDDGEDEGDVDYYDYDSTSLGDFRSPRPGDF